MSALSDEFEKWWKAVSNDEYVPIGIEDRHVARLAWRAAIAADRAARAEPEQVGLMGAIREIPTREEYIGGQRFKYVRLCEVLDTIAAHEAKRGGAA